MDYKIKMLFDMFIVIPSIAVLIIGIIDFAIWKVKRILKHRKK